MPSGPQPGREVHVAEFSFMGWLARATTYICEPRACCVMGWGDLLQGCCIACRSGLCTWQRRCRDRYMVTRHEGGKQQVGWNGVFGSLAMLQRAGASMVAGKPNPFGAHRVMRHV